MCSSDLKLSKENTIEVSELEKTDKELALNDKVDTYVIFFVRCLILIRPGFRLWE